MRDSRDCNGAPALKLTLRDSGLPRELGVGRGTIEVRVEDCLAQLRRGLVIAGKYGTNDSFERRNRIRRAHLGAHALHQRNRR